MTGLAALLKSIVQADEEKNYLARNKMIFLAMIFADELGYNYGVRIDPVDPEWPVAFIELPSIGQVSWHLPQFSHAWDGHSTAEKNQRIANYSRMAG